MSELLGDFLVNKSMLRIQISDYKVAWHTQDNGNYMNDYIKLGSLDFCLDKMSSIIN